MQHYYPLFLDLSGRDVLVVGAGSVGKRKIHSLLNAGPRSITVVDPGLTPELRQQLEMHPGVLCRAGGFFPEDVQGKSLVFAATNDAAVNAAVAALCAEHGILCNIADAPGASSFLVPAHFCRDGIHVALSTGGHSPALARLLREELEGFIGSRYSALLGLLGRLRPLLLELGLSSEANTRIFRTLVRSSLPRLLSSGDYETARALLSDELPEALHPHLDEILHDV